MSTIGFLPNPLSWVMDMVNEDLNNLGFYPDYATFVAVYPTGVAGQYVLLGSTDSFRVRDVEGAVWKDSNIGPAHGLTEKVQSDLNVGGIVAQQTLSQGTTLTAFVKALLQTTFYPTFVAPTFSLTSNQANNQEIGSVVTLNLTYNFWRGSILGKLVGGVWQPATFQDYRAGVATSVAIAGNPLPLTVPYTYSVPNYTLLATQTFWSVFSYDDWPQPIDSHNANYSTPLPWDVVITANNTITAIYPYFYGKVSGGSKPTKDQALINSWNKVVAGSSSTITVSFGSVATDRIWFAIPATSTSKTTWYIDALNNWPIGGVSNLFDTETSVAIDSPTVLRNWVQYKIYVSNYQSAVSSAMQLRN